MESFRAKNHPTAGANPKLSEKEKDWSLTGGNKHMTREGDAQHDLYESEFDEGGGPPKETTIGSTLDRASLK